MKLLLTLALLSATLRGGLAHYGTDATMYRAADLNGVPRARCMIARFDKRELGWRYRVTSVATGKSVIATVGDYSHPKDVATQRRRGQVAEINPSCKTRLGLKLTTATRDNQVILRRMVSTAGRPTSPTALGVHVDDRPV